MRKLYKSDKPIPAPKPKPKREKKPAPVIVPIDPEEWPDESQPPVKDADDGG
jgi:hypothetical protein